MKIRLAHPSDAAQLLSIYRPFIENTAITFETNVPSEKEFAERIISYTKKYPWLVAEVNGIAAGYAYAVKHREREAYQWCVESSVYVHEDFRGQGIAQQLYEKLFGLLKEMGFVNVYAGITLPNEKSYQLHTKLGFTPVGIYEKIGFKNSSWHSVQWFVKAINEYADNPLPPKGIGSILHNLD